MSRENADLIHRVFEAIGRRDLEAWLGFMDPQVVAVPRILAVEGGSLHGHAGVREWWDAIFSAFPNFSVEVVAVRATGEATVAHVLARGRGQESGVPFEDNIWVASRLRGEKVIRWQTFDTEAEALEAVGLRELPRQSPTP